MTNQNGPRNVFDVWLRTLFLDSRQMKCLRCHNSAKYSRSVALSPLGSRPWVSPKRSSTLGSLARGVFSISRRKCSSSVDKTRRARFGVGEPVVDTVRIIRVQVVVSSRLAILNRLAGLKLLLSSGTTASTCVSRMLRWQLLRLASISRLLQVLLRCQDQQHMH